MRFHIKYDSAMDTAAEDIVANYVKNTVKLNMLQAPIEVYIVWKCKILQNWKYLISTNIQDGMYYEVTYNGAKDEWYLDAYQKVENEVIKGNTASKDLHSKK